MDATIISGMNKPYPLDSSAIKKIDVSGAFITPDITPDIPTSVNDTIERFHPKSRLQLIANVAPINAPMKSDGANVPPIPPAAVVADIAITLKNIIATRKSINAQSSYLKSKNSELSNSLIGSPCISAVILS